MTDLILIHELLRGQSRAHQALINEHENLLNEHSKLI